jgi:hypothetical protein
MAQQSLCWRRHSWRGGAQWPGHAGGRGYHVRLPGLRDDVHVVINDNDDDSKN